MKRKNNNKDSPDWWEKACKDLSNKDEIMKILIKKYDDSSISTVKNPFFSLSRCIVGQQISVQAADAVWNRLTNKFNIYDENVLKALGRFSKSFGLSKENHNT